MRSKQQNISKKLISLHTKKPFQRSLGKWCESKQMGITSVESIEISFRPISDLTGHFGVSKRSKKAVFGEDKAHWAPRPCPKSLEVCQKVLYQWSQTMQIVLCCFSLGVSWGAQELFSLGQTRQHFCSDIYSSYP